MGRQPATACCAGGGEGPSTWYLSPPLCDVVGVAIGWAKWAPPKNPSPAQVWLGPKAPPPPLPAPEQRVDLMSLYPSAPGSHLLRVATAKDCPGLGRHPSPATEWLGPDRLTNVSPWSHGVYTDRLGYHHRDLRDVLPPMTQLRYVQAAVDTAVAERYFHLEGAPSSSNWVDSRRILGLKLPTERHAHGYALREVWNPPAREASAATTVLERTAETTITNLTRT